jgi:hypothetical protein
MRWNCLADVETNSRDGTASKLTLTSLERRAVLHTSRRKILNILPNW